MCLPGVVWVYRCAPPHLFYVYAYVYLVYHGCSGLRVSSCFTSIQMSVWGRMCEVPFTPVILYLYISQLRRLVHCQRLKPFVISVWVTHYRRQYKFIEIRLRGDQRFWIASSANATPCHVYTRHCIWESTDCISKEYRTFTRQQRRLLRQSKSTNPFGTILFDMAIFTFESSY